METRMFNVFVISFTLAKSSLQVGVSYDVGLLTGNIF